MDKIVVPIQLNGVNLTGIVDTGAEYTLLSTKGAKKAKLFYKINRKTNDKVRGVSGISKVYGYLQQQEIQLGLAKIE